MHVILHIGPHKTGTSSIQKTLSSSRSLLSDNDITYYSDDVFNPNNHYIFHHAFTPCLESHFHTLLFKKLSVVSQNDLKDSIRRHISACKTSNLVVSSEDLSILPADGVRALRRFLLEACSVESVTVVGMVRDPFDYLLSSIQQYIKPGLTDIDDIVDNIYSNYSLQSCPDFNGGAASILLQVYFPAFFRYLNEFGPENCKFLKFEDCAQRGLASAVLQYTLGAGEKVAPKELRSNSSMSKEAAILISVYNSQNKRQKSDSIVASRNKQLVDILKSIRGEKAAFPIKMSDAELSEVNATIARVNEVMGYPAMNFLSRSRIEGMQSDPTRFSRQSMSEIVEIIDNLLAERNPDSGLADKYRDAGIELSRSRPEIAYLLMKRAAELRPEGKIIKDRLRDLELKLQDRASNAGEVESSGGSATLPG